MELQEADTALQPLWSSLAYSGSAWVGPLLLLGVSPLSSSRPWWSGWLSHSLFPFFIWLLVASNPWHHAFYTGFTTTEFLGRPITIYAHGWAFWFYILGTYVYSALSTAIVLHQVFKSRNHAWSGALWIGAFCLPWIASFTYVSGYSPLDLTPLAFSIMAIIISLAMRHYSFVDPTPFARNSLVENLLDGVLVFDQDGVLRDANPAAKVLLGRDLRLEATSTADLPLSFSMKQETRHVLVGERELEIQSVLLGSHQKPLGSLHILHDTTERMHSEARIRLLSQAVEAGPTAMLVTDLQGHIVFVNKRFCSTSGYSEAEVLGQSPRLFNSGFHSHEFFQNLWTKLTLGQAWRGEIRNKRKNGTLYWHRADLSPLRSAQGEITHFVALTEDITERKAMQDRLEQIASTDPLTGLYNRNFILQMGQKEFARHRRNQRQLSIAMLDIDHLKKINDHLGHAMGDRILRTVADMIRSVFREDDLLGRFGGDEFLLLFPDTARERASQACERLREQLASSPLTSLQGDIFFTASVGVATLTTEASLEALIQRASMALDKAKENGNVQLCGPE